MDINGLLTIKFNDEAAEVSNRKGTIHLSTQLDVKQHIEEIVTEEQINEDGSTSGEVKIKIAKAAIKKPDRSVMTTSSHGKSTSMKTVES